MRQDIVNPTLPAGYPVRTTESCTLRAHCLHALVAPELLRTSLVYPQINAHHPDYREGTACALYRPDTPERYARGFARAMSELSRRNYDACTDHMIGRSSKTQFYRLKRGELPLSPREQQEVAEILRAYGYEGDEPFDSYEMRYTWD